MRRSERVSWRTCGRRFRSVWVNPAFPSLCSLLHLARRLVFLANLRRSCEFVTNARHRNNEAWRCRVRLDLVSQPCDEHVNAAVKGVDVSRVNRVTQLGARQNAAGIANESDKQRKFAGRQRELPVVSV